MFKDIKNDIETLERQLTAPRFDVDKALREIEFLAWAFLLATFALKIFGFDVGTPSIENERLLTVIHFVDSNNMVRIAITSFLNLVLFVCFCKYIFQQKSNKCVGVLSLLALPFIVLIVVFNVLEHISILSILVAFVPYVFYFLIKPNFIFFVKYLFFDLILQLISTFTKSINIFEDTSFLFYLISHADYYCMWAICMIRIKRGDKWLFSLVDCKDFLKNALIKSWQELKSIAMTLKAVPTRLKKKSLRTWCVYLKARLKIFVRCELKLLIKHSVAPVVIVFGIYFGYAYFVDKLLQAVFLYIAYLHLRKLFPKHFHADYIPNIKKNYISITCICLSSLMLCTALYNVIGGGLSVISSIIVAFVVDWLLYVIRDWLDRLASDPVVMELIANFNRKIKHLYSEDEIRAYFVQFMTLDKYHDYLIYTLSEGKRDADWFKLECNRGKDIDEQQYRNYKTKFKKLIKNN